MTRVFLRAALISAATIGAGCLTWAIVDQIWGGK